MICGTGLAWRARPGNGPHRVEVTTSDAREVGVGIEARF
jgi:hypothetical protein